MRMIVLDILMGGVVVLAIVIMVPMPWLLAPSRYYAISENKVIGCDVTAQKDVKRAFRLAELINGIVADAAATWGAL
ncbi:Uncharacterised protein [Budvicia aquatica]|uniref:Uncharacterized protein n=2 Tax=Budvicia aquatica TaxID=82979 RepID=A0A484ZIX2_9GAMM|nr:Uncharacterised protein [Budvicia aquatica]